MKRLIIIILIILLVPTSYVSAEDKEPVDLVKDNTLMVLRGYIPLMPHSYVFLKEGMTRENEMMDCLDCMDEQRQILNYGRMGIGGEITNPFNEYYNEKIKTSPFSWMIIPNFEESQPSGIIQFTYSY